MFDLMSLLAFPSNVDWPKSMTCHLYRITWLPGHCHIGCVKFGTIGGGETMKIKFSQTCRCRNTTNWYIKCLHSKQKRLNQACTRHPVTSQINSVDDLWYCQIVYHHFALASRLMKTTRIVADLVKFFKSESSVIF